VDEDFHTDSDSEVAEEFDENAKSSGSDDNMDESGSDTRKRPAKKQKT